MDEDSDEEVGLSNLHHGLDSSLDEEMSGSGKQDLRPVHHSNSVDSHNEDMVTENQINLLQDMVVEMKQGFQAALQELAKIQDKDEAEGNHSKQMQQQQQRQLDHMTETIGEIKQQLSSLTRNVDQIRDDQQTLKSRLDAVSSRDISQENNMSVDRGSSKRPSLMDDNPAHSEEWNSKFPAQPAETGTNKTVNEATSAVRKGQSLMQALGEECLKLSLSQSSNEEEEDQELLRLSRYRHKPGYPASSQTTDRQQTKSGSVGSQDRHQTILNAAQRQKSVMELADSERDYSSQLWSLLHTYLTPLQTAGFLSARELDTLFPLYLEQMYMDHCHICTGLQDRLIHWTYTSTVADLLERFTDSYNSDSLLSLYKEYADDLPAGLSCLRRALAQSSEFRVFLKAVQHSSCQSETLMSLLLAPMDRIPKFLLQLQEVSRHTPATHTDSPHLQSLLHQLQLFVDQLNDDLFHTIQDLNSDKQARSEYMNGHVLNGRDSGIHSNSTEEDNLISARALSKTRRSYVSSEWLDNPYYSSNIRQPWSPSGRASALSQPDLTTYMDRVVADPLEYAHMPRSQSALPTAESEDVGGEAPARRQVQKFKIRRRNPSPVGYTSTQDHNRSISPRVRPSSAVDFLNHSLHQQYHKHNTSDNFGVSRNYQYPGPKPRPQSALGPQNLSFSHRPVVISRKNIRRPQPPPSTSDTFWSEPKTSAMPVRVGHQKAHLAAEDLFPSCYILQRRATVLDGHDGDDDDDDTRASDAVSFDNFESCLNGHGQGINNNYETGLDLPHNHRGNNRYETGLDLPQSDVNYQMAKNSSLTYDAAKSADSAEILTDDAPRRIYSSKQETAKDGRGIRRGSKDLPKPKSMSVSKYQPSQVPSQKNDNLDIKQLSESQNEDKTLSKPAGNSTHIPRLEHRNAKEQTALNESSLLSEIFSHGDNSVTSVSSSGFNVSQETDEHEPSKKKHTLKTVSKPESAIDDRAGKERSKQVSETNRQFLLRLSSRTSAIGKGDLARPCSAGTNTENKEGNVIEISNKSHSLQSNSDTSESFSPDDTSASQRVLPYIPPRYNRIGNSQVNQASIAKGTIDHGKTKPMLPPKRHLKHSPSVSQDASKASSDIPDYESPVKYDHNSPQTLSSSSITYPQSPSVLSQNASILSQISLSLEHQYSPSRPKPLFTSSLASMPPPPPEFSSDPTSKVNGHNYDDHISYTSSLEPQPLDLADLDVNGEKGRRHSSVKYKVKDEGSIQSSDNYSMASDDNTNARKKMHFKTTLKNLFAKKKGRVVLADIEKQVAMEMASTGATTTDMSHSSNMRGPHSGEKGTSHKTIGEPLTELKTQKDQGSSTSSPVKAHKKFKFRPRSEKEAESVNEFGPGKGTDCEPNQPEKNMLKCLNLRNKRHGIILENSDTELAKMLEAGGDSACSSEPSNYRHSYTQDRSCSSQPYFLQRPRSEVMACGAFSDGMKPHGKPGDKQNLLEQVKKQVDLRNCMEVRKATSCEPDLLQFASGYKSNKKKVVHTTYKDTVATSSSASDNEINAQKSSGYCYREQDIKKPQLSGFDLCQQCQKNELRQIEATEGNVHTIKCQVQDCAVGMSEKVSDNASASQVVLEYRNFGNVGCAVVQTSPQSRCMLDRVGDIQTPEHHKQFSYIDDPTISISADVTEEKPEDGTFKKTTMANSFPVPCYVQRMKKEKLGDRSRFGTLSPVYEQPSPKPRNMAHSMPDVAKCSTLVASWSDSNTTSSSSTEAPQMSSPPARLLCNTADFNQNHGLELSNTVDTNTSLISSASTQLVTTKIVSSSPFHVSSSHQKLNSSGKEDNCVSDSQPLVPVETSVSDLAGEAIFNNQQSTTENIESSECDPHRESSRHPAISGGDNEMFVKCSSLEDRQSFEYRYRLYYDDEADASKSHNPLENPKSLKALSASCVIREHFRQSPWNETSSCFKNHQASNHHLPLLTLEVPFINIPNKRQQTPSSASALEGCPDGDPDGRERAVYSSRHLPNPSESSCSNLGAAVLNICRSQTSPQLSVHRLPLVGRLSLHNPTDHGDNARDLETSTNRRDSLAAAHKSHPPIVSRRHQEVVLKLSDNETSLKLPPASNDYDEDDKYVKPVVLECSSGDTASSSAVDYDESNSYKPKHPRPLSQLPNVVECQIGECFRSDDFGCEDNPDASATGVSSKHSPGMDSEAAVPSSYTKSTSLNHGPLMHSSINQASNTMYNQFHSHIQIDRNPLCAENCMTRRSWSFGKGRDHSATNSPSEVSGRAVSPVVYFCKQSTDDPFLQEGCTFLRTSSPYDPTTLRTNGPRKPSSTLFYKDSAQSTNSPGSTSISPEADKTTAKDITKSVSKEPQTEKEDKCPRPTAYARMKPTFEEDTSCQKSCKKWVFTESSSLVPSSGHNSNSRRHRHSGGAKFRCHEQQFYLPQNPRYSADSNPLIQTAFLHKMACLPEYMNKQSSNLQVDEKTSHTIKGTNRHSKIHLDVTRKSYGPIDGKSSKTARSNPSPKMFSLSGASSEIQEGDFGQSSHENHHQRPNTGSTETAQSSPDLLPSKEPSRADADIKDKTSACKKAQSFFSRLTNSPMSFFYKESKPSNPPS